MAAPDAPPGERLPRGFEDQLRTAGSDPLIEMLESYSPDARTWSGGPTVPGMPGCPPEVIRRLADRGADLGATDRDGNTPLHLHAMSGDDAAVAALLDLGADLEARSDRWGETPLHAAARSHRPSTVRLLVERGADASAGLPRSGRTPLERSLATCRSSDVAATAEIAQMLVAAGAEVTAEVRKQVERIGRGLARDRDDADPELVDAADAGLSVLYEQFGMTPVPTAEASPRRHDGVSPITVTATGWRRQHEELWDLLVPPAGVASTVQGEVVRITGRVARELVDDAGNNWDADFRAMVDALPVHLGSATPLPAPELQEAARLARRVRTGSEAGLDRLTELVVRWVLANPGPIPLEPPRYRR